MAVGAVGLCEGETDPPSPLWGTAHREAMREHSKVTVCEPGRENYHQKLTLPGLYLGLPASRTEKVKSCPLS